jgi:CTP synthase (UTP-ammonia lyase)
LGVEHAQHAETSPDAENLVVTPLSCSLVGQEHRVALVPGSRVAAAYGAGEVLEDYYCNYGLSPDYRPQLEEAGLCVTGFDDEGEARVVELPSHPFFIATLFCFQTRPRAERPHPLVAAFVTAADR